MTDKTKIYTYDEYDSGKVPDTGEEIFDAVYGPTQIIRMPNGGAGPHRTLRYYKGRESGIRLGPWFAEIMETVNS